MTIGIYYAKTHFSELMERAERGEEFEITKNGKVKGRIAPPAAVKMQKTAGEAIARMRELRKGNRLGKDLTIKQLIEEGRRF